MCCRRRGSRRRRWSRNEKALAIRQKLADANPAVTEFQNDLALCHSQIGASAPADGEAGGGAVAYRKALAIFQKLADANPAVSRVSS